MKITKRVLAILVAITLALGAFALSAAANTDPTFATVNEGMEFWRILYLVVVKSTADHPQEFVWDDAVHFKAGSNYSLMAQELRALLFQYFPSAGWGAAAAAQQQNRLIPWAQGVVAELNQIYAKHLNQAGMDYLYGTVKPQQARFANAASLADTYFDVNPAAKAPYTDIDDLYLLPDRPDVIPSPLTFEGLINGRLALWNFYAGKVTAVLPAVPTGDPTEPLYDTASGILVLGALPAGAALSVTALSGPPNNNTGYKGPGNVKLAWEVDFTGVSLPLPQGAYVELYLPVTGLTLAPGPLPSNINVFHKGSKITSPAPVAVVLGGITYIKVQVNSFSPFEIVEESESTATTTATQKWWEKLPNFVQWLLRIFAFGWIWMK